MVLFNRVNKFGYGGAGGAQSFSPDQINNLEAWWNASRTESITDASGSVTQIDDLTGSGRNAVGGGSVNPVTGTRTINGKNVLDFSNGKLTIPYGTWMQHASSGFTVIMIGKNDVITNTEAWINRYSQLAGNRCWLLGNNATGTQYYGNTTTDGTNFQFVNSGIAINTNVNLLALSFGGNGDPLGTKLYYNNATPVASNGAERDVFEGAQDMVIGSLDGGAIPMDGAFCEAMYFSRELTTAEFNQIGNYAKNEWGVAWT